MILTEALLIAQAGGEDYYPMRQASWVHGLEIWWSRWRCAWVWTSAENAAPERLSGVAGVLSPDAMLADDWEVVTQ